MMLVFIFFLNLFLINESKIHFWRPEDIKNPLTNRDFCKLNVDQESFLCDPEDVLPYILKKKVSEFLIHNIPSATPCFCNAECDILDFRQRLMIGIVVVNSINETIPNCPEDRDKSDCFSENVLNYWNISQCSGNNGLILVTRKKTHIYFGEAVYKKLPAMCITRLKSYIRPFDPLHYNLRTLFRNTLHYIRKPCTCNDSCAYRHLKWLTNVVFFMGVIVLVTCIGGMSRRALVAKFHDRPLMNRNNIFCTTIYRQPLIEVQPTQNDNNESYETPGRQVPPGYSLLDPLPKPPPYIPIHYDNIPKNYSVHGFNERSVNNVEDHDLPPPYGFASSELVESSNPHGNHNRPDVQCNNNPAYHN